MFNFKLEKIISMINRSFFLLLFFLLTVHVIQGQNKPNYLGQTNTITTAVPFLLIAPDSRAGGMGDAGVATTPDASSMHWNPAKYAFIDSKAGFAATYSPWLRAIVSDINLAYVAGFYKIDDRQTIASSLLFFSLGDITFTDIRGDFIGNYRPNELAIDATYSRKFSDKWSGAVAARYINSNLTQGINVSGVATKPGRSIAADVSVYHQQELNWRNVEYAEFAFGLNISNIGSKISYSDATTDTDFIPTNLRFGPRLSIDLDEYNRLSFFADVNKLLVPTPPIYALDENGQTITDENGNKKIEAGKDPNVNTIQGLLQSWYDAPGGFSEEMREFYYSIGTEYWYNKAFAVRAGYFWEHENKGNRKYFTLGAGLKYNVFGLDFSYLIPTQQRNPDRKSVV